MITATSASTPWAWWAFPLLFSSAAVAVAFSCCTPLPRFKTPPVS